jgi:hypothetical protein
VGDLWDCVLEHNVAMASWTEMRGRQRVRARSIKVTRQDYETVRMVLT